MSEADYEYLGKCQFPGGYMGNNGQEADCREVAIAKVWWEEYDDALFACPTHFTQATGQPGLESLSTMRAALLQLEWMNKTATQDLCPWCDEAKTDGHDPDCIIAAALSTTQPGGESDDVV